MPDIAQLGKGAVADQPDQRDLQAGFVFGAKTITWNPGLRLPEPPDENQDSSLSCVSQAWSYFHWQLKTKAYSRRDLYSRIRLPQGTAYLRDGGKELCSNGQQTRAECPDPANQTEAAMSIRCANPGNGLDDLEANYFTLNDDIDSVAIAIRDYRGVVFGIYGNNAGWSDLTNPHPPAAGQSAEWAHALYGMGYHMHNGQKCIIAKSSWCFPGHHEHHIKQEYFNAGRVFNAWVLIPKENLPMIRRFKVNDHGTLGVALIVDGSFDFTVYRAKSQEHYQALLKFYEVPADALTISIP